MNEVRCTNPYKGGICNKKLGDHVEGVYINKCCPRCRLAVYIDTRVSTNVG